MFYIPIIIALFAIFFVFFLIQRIKNSPSGEGKIVEISADTIVDKESKDGKSYYRVLVKTDKNYLEKRGKKLPIIPGMVATVDIVTGKKTILDFLLKPILKVKQDSLHER